MKLFFSLLLGLGCLAARAQDSSFIKVHFLYGSKPLKQYKTTEHKWFGGMLGGHVGIEGDSGRILNFVPKGHFHWIAKKDERHSSYAEHTESSFYAILGGNADSMKKLVVTIPVSAEQKKKFDSIATAYLHETPYDYALVGMRCGAAAYEILGQLGIVKSYSYKKTYRKIFYPKKLRKRLLARAGSKGWTLYRQQGCATRKWERD
jgi:hypothetical protein